MAQATWNDTVIAQAGDDDVIRIEGNIYFPPDSVNRKYLEESDQQTTCFWKGDANYYDVVVGEEVNAAAAWYYPVPKEGSVERVGKDFSNYVAFWNGIEVS